MESHVKAVGILYILYGTITLAGIGIASMFFGGLAQVFMHAAGHSHAGDAALSGFALVIAIVLGIAAVLALPGIIGGIGVLSYQNWARWVLGAISALHIFAFPVGTIIGGYTLWVLFNEDSNRLFT